MWVLLLILKIILYIIAALLLLLVTLLIVPFSYKGEASVYGEVSFSYSLGWFWNLINIRGTRNTEKQNTELYLGNKRILTVKTKVKSKAEDDEVEVDEKDKEASKKENDFKSMFDVKLIKEALNLIKKIIKQLSPKYLHLNGTYGFDDPSVTGMTAGFIYTIKSVMPESHINLQPSFTEEIFEVDFKAAGSVSAGKLVLDTAKFLLNKDVRKKIFKRNKKVKLNKK